MDKRPKLSVIIPAYNEEKRIGKTLADIDRYLKARDYEYEIIVVDNGSKDSTCDVVKEYQGGDTKHWVRLCLSQSVGAKGSAVKLGVTGYAKGDYVMFMDADNATPVSEVEKFWPYFESGQYEMVIGSRYTKDANVRQKQPFYRVILSRMSNLLIQMLVAPGIKDTQLGFKMFTRKAARDIFSQVTVEGWGFDMEVIAIARKHGYRIKEVGVFWRERGGSHVPPKAYLESLIDLVKIKSRSLAGRYNKN